MVGCWTCHGLKGAGRGPAARRLTDATDRPIRTTDFRHDPLKGGSDPAAIVRTLRTGLNGAPMPSYDAAMLFAREDFDDPSLLPEPFSGKDRSLIAEYLLTVPTRARLGGMDEARLAELRHRRLASLAHYVLSLHRDRFWHWMFHEQPELEARR